VGLAGNFFLSSPQIWKFGLPTYLEQWYITDYKICYLTHLVTPFFPGQNLMRRSLPDESVTAANPLPLRFSLNQSGE
jgi:hypothetical protein